MTTPASASAKGPFTLKLYPFRDISVTKAKKSEVADQKDSLVSAGENM